MRNNKYIPYGRQNISHQDITAVIDALKSDFITQGPKIEEFESALCKYTGAKYAVVVSSGTAALHLSMMALNIGKGDGIITSPITFSASANCALYVGARPLFIDIDDTTYHLDIEKLKDFLKVPSRRRKIKAVIPVHFMGTVMDIRELKKICDRYGIRIVEDAAHALGAKYKISDKNEWIKVGSSRHSDIAVFSFHPIKHITTGEGGAILTNNKKIYKLALRLRHHGIVKKRQDFWFYDMLQVGFNYRITDFQCALGISQLKKLDEMVRIRRDLVKRYNDNLSDIGEIMLPCERQKTYASYHLYVIRVPAAVRDELYYYLRRNNIYTQVNYIPAHLFTYYRKEFGYKPGDFPVAEKYSKECLSLPLYTMLTESEQLRVISKIKRFFKK